MRPDQSFLGVGYGCIGGSTGFPVSVHQIDPVSGALRLDALGIVSSQGDVTAIAIGPFLAGKRLFYVGIYTFMPSMHAVATYRVDGEGRMTRLATQVGADARVATIVPDPLGRFCSSRSTDPEAVPPVSSASFLTW